MARMTPRKVALATSFTALKPHQSERSGGTALLSEGLQIRPSKKLAAWAEIEPNQPRNLSEEIGKHWYLALFEDVLPNLDTCF